MSITILLRIVIPTRIECFIHERNAYRWDCHELGEAVFLPDNGRGEGEREGGAENDDRCRHRCRRRCRRHDFRRRCCLLLVAAAVAVTNAVFL